MIQATYTYGPYGEPSDWTGPRFRYTGQVVLPEVQAYFYKARLYDPVMGRFLQTDPIGMKDDPNLYAYVKDDPTNGADPTGTACTGSLIAASCGDSGQGVASSSSGTAFVAGTGTSSAPTARTAAAGTVGAVAGGTIAVAASGACDVGTAAGEVWKYGTTADPGGRYAASALQGLGLQMQIQSSGNRAQVLVQEKIKLIEHYSQTGRLPPGNRIFK